MPAVTEMSAPAEILLAADPPDARFATRWLTPAVAVFSAHGDIDASNADDLADYTLSRVGRCRRMILDLSGLDFFGTAGLAALQTVYETCADMGVDWAMVPSAVVSRLLQICDPEGVLPTVGTDDAALARLRGEPLRLMQLVAQTT